MKKKPTKINAKDVQLAYLMDGIDGVNNLAPSKITARKALQALLATGRDTSTFAAWVTETYGQDTGKKGRAPPEAGQTRSYKAQALNGQSPFLRLPLGILGVSKTQSVSVSFGSDEIIIRRR